MVMPQGTFYLPGAGHPRDRGNPCIRLLGLETDESWVRSNESDAKGQLHEDVQGIVQYFTHPCKNDMPLFHLCKFGSWITFNSWIFAKWSDEFGTIQEKSAELWPSSGAWGASIWSGELRYNIEDFERLDHLTGELNMMKKEHDFIRCKCLL